MLKTKDEAFGRFRDWLVATENKCENKLKHLRTDNGLEFVSSEFNDFCKARGITRHMTVKHTPQQNGVAERMNRTLLERVRCMLISAGLPKTFWGEAISTAAYLINRSPSSAIDLKTPAEKWYGKPADYKNLRVFGCQAYAHIKQDKLEPRALKCIFIGYPEGVKWYKLWCLEPENAKCLISRDVVFDENTMANLKQYKITNLEREDHGTHVEVEIPGKMSSQDEDKDSVETDFPNTNTEVETDLSHYNLARDRQRRQIRLPARYAQADITSFAFSVVDYIDEMEPRTYKDVLGSRDKQKWIAAMDEELDSLIKNQTWELTSKPKTQRVIGYRWIFQKKRRNTRG